MAETIDYAPMIPREHPEHLAGWVLEQGGLKKEYLIYKADWEYDPLEDRNKPAVRVVCSACGRAFVAMKVDAGGCGCNYPPAPFGWWNELTGESVISGNNTMCPVCGAETETVHVSKIPRGISQMECVTTVSKLPVEGKKDRLLLTEWEVSRETDKNGESRFFYHIWTAWVVEDKKIIRIKGWTRCLSSLYRHPPEQRKTFMDDSGKAWLIYPWEPSVLEGTTAENSKLDLYIDAGGEYLVAYLALWRKRPAVENLVTQGYGSLVNDLIDRDQYHSSYSRNKGIPQLKEINWEEKKPHRMLGLTKDEFRACAGRMTKDGFLLIKEARERGAEVRVPEDIHALERAGKYAIGEILQTNPALFRKTLKYIGMGQDRNWITLRDYWKMATALKMDLDNAQVRWPKDLKVAHDKVMVRYKSHKSELVNQGIVDHAAQLNCLAFHSDGILIRPCATHEELIREGKELHHCVASYADRYAEGRTAILLIRSEAEPDKPWFTLEMDEEKLTVRQNRGLRNCARTPEVQVFEEKWLKWAKNQSAKTASRKNAAAKKSKKATTAA